MICHLISTVTLLKALWKLAPPNKSPLGCKPHGPGILSQRYEWSTRTRQEKDEERPCPCHGSGADRRQLCPCTARGNTACPGIAVPHSRPPGCTGGGCEWEKPSDLDEGHAAPPGGTGSGSATAASKSPSWVHRPVSALSSWASSHWGWEGWVSSSWSSL